MTACDESELCSSCCVTMMQTAIRELKYLREQTTTRNQSCVEQDVDVSAPRLKSHLDEVRCTVWQAE